MKFTLLEIQTDVLLVYLISGVISLIIFYYIIKGAVKNGMIEADAEIKIKRNNIVTPVVKSTNDFPSNSDQEKLKLRYDKGEITFEEYKREWERLK